MLNPKTKNILYVLVITVVALAGAYLLIREINQISNESEQPLLSDFSFKEKNQQVTNQQTVNDDTRDWKTYINEEYGYQFQYPKDWEVRKDEGYPYGLFVGPSDRTGIFLRIDPLNSRMETVFDVGVKPACKITTVIFSGKQSLECKTDNNNLYFREIRVSDIKNTAWEFSNRIAYSVKNEDLSEKNIMDDILSTFKFIKPKDPTFRYLNLGEVLDYNSVKWNFDSPNSSITYFNRLKGFSFRVPFNESWGNNEIRLRPYEIVDDKVYFGNLDVSCEGDCVMSRGSHVYVQTQESAEVIVENLKKDPNFEYFVSKPQFLKFDDLEMIKYSSPHDLCPELYVIVIGKRYNYVFSTNCSGSFKDLEEVARTIKFLDIF